MTREEVTSLIEKIKAFRPSFLTTKTLMAEWFKVLEPYDYYDVDKKLDEFFKDGDNFGKYPDVYLLIKQLKTLEEKAKKQEIKIECKICRKILGQNEAEKHYERCSSVDYLSKMSEKYYNRRLDKVKLLNLSSEEFDDKYWKFCEKLFGVMEEGLQKHCLKNALLQHEGKTPEFNLQQLKSVIKM